MKNESISLWVQLLSNKYNDLSFLNKINSCHDHSAVLCIVETQIVLLIYILNNFDPFFRNALLEKI